MIACCTSSGTSDNRSFWLACVSLRVGRLRFMIFRRVVVGGEAVVVGHITHALMITMSPSQPTWTIHCVCVCVSPM